MDPATSISWETLADSAAEVRQALQKFGLESFLKLTGGKGLHIVVPIEAHYGWATIKAFVRAFALQMERQNPTLYLTKMTKAARKNRIYLDYLRNERGATAVAAFSPCARSRATVSMPLSWGDLRLPRLPIFHAADYERWKERLKHDPWKQLLLTGQNLTAHILDELNVSLSGQPEALPSEK